MHNKLFQDHFIEIPDAQVRYYEDLYAFAKAESLKNTILVETPWRQNEIKVFGKTHPEPRLTQLYGDAGIEYGYSGIRFNALAWTPTLLEIKKTVEKVANTSFNVCLINQYRDGQDSNGWHADNEKELGTNPVIASVSLGQERYFHLKHNHNKELRFKFPLHNGSLLIMEGKTQHTYKHQIAKTARNVDIRINLTFRNIKEV